MKELVAGVKNVQEKSERKATFKSMAIDLINSLSKMRLLHLNSLCNFKNARVIQGKTGLPLILTVDIKTIVHTTQGISSTTYRMSFSSLIISMALDSHISSLDADFLSVK